MNRLHELARPQSPDDTGFIGGSFHESARRYRTLLESIDQGYCVLEVLFDPADVAADYRFLEVNAAFERLTGLHAAVGRTMRQMHPRQEDHWFETFGRVARTGQPVRFESQAGHTGDRWFDLYAFPAGQPGNGHVGVLFADITDRKRTEDALRASEARFREFADAAPATLWVTEPDGGCSFLSRGWYEFTGQTAVTGLGYGWLDAVHPDDRAAAQDKFLAANARREPFALEHRLRRGDGEYRWVIDTGQPRTGPGGAFLGYIGSVIDIDDRKRAAADLFRSREALRAVLDSIPQRVFWKDVNLVYLGCNRPFAEDMGCRSPDDVVGKTDFECPWVSAAEGYRADDRRVIDTAAPKLDFEEEYPAADGTSSWVRTSKVPLYDPTGRVAGVLGIFEDVTERKRAEAVLRESEARFRSLVEALPDAVFINVGGRVVFCNPAYLRLLGATDPAQVLGRSPLDFYTPAYHEQIRGRIKVLRDTRRPLPPIEEDVLRLDGQAVPVQVTALPITDGGAEAALVVLHDLTERKRVEQQLRNQELLLREAAELAHVGGWSFDPHTLQGDWTPEAARIHGVDPAAEMSVADGLARFPPPDCHRVEAALTAAIEHGTPCDLEADFTAATGERKRVRAICRPVVEGGRVVRVRGSFQDVTARHTLEEKLRHSQKMEAFGQIAGGVAHDFNNMLQVINGYADLLLEDLPADDPTAALVREIRRAGERSATLTRQLLAFARQQVVAPRVLDVSAVASGTVAMLRRVLGEGVRLTADLPAGLWAVRIDAGELEQVLMNLAINARDAMPRGGSLVVATRNEVVNPEDADQHPDVPAGRYVVLAVTDTGVGMPPAVMARVFEPFFTTKEVGQGTGLGLSTVFGIVQQAGGHLRVRSQVGAGSTFEVFLPPAELEEQGGEPADARTPLPVTETVLVVEDEEAVRLLIRTVLTGRGYTVLEAVDGEEAERVAAAHAGPIHLVLCDVIMPGADGRVVAAQILARHPHAKTLLMSGHADDVIVRHGVQAAAVPFLKKPFTPSQLTALVRQVIDAP